MKTYNDFIEELKEGLIRTHDINKYHSAITDYLDQLGIKSVIDITNTLSFNLVITTNNYDVIQISSHKCYTLGYFPSYYWITLNNNMTNGFKTIDKLPENTKYVKIRFEAKYTDGLYTNDIICPEKLYHLTYQENKNNILKKGLYPKSKNRISIHPERIYLFYNMENYNQLLNILKYSDQRNNINKKYMLLEINCINDNLIIHSDPNYQLGCFTYDNINPKNIKFIIEKI